MHASIPLPVAIAALTAIFVVGVRSLRARAKESYKRGVVLLGPDAPRRRSPADLTLAGHAVAAADETKHFKIIGTTGTGKSTAIRELLGAALERGDRAVLADPDGGYCRRYFRRRRGDVILNPFDLNSLRWDPFAELESAFDVEQLALGLIPASDDASSSEWRGYARTFLCAVLRHLWSAPRRDAGELWRLLAVASVEELRGVVLNTPAQPFLDADNARMFGSIRAVAVSALAAFEHVEAQRAAPFSVRTWVRTRRLPGVLFIPYKATQIAALKSMIATWMRLAIFEAMNGDELRDQRLWFIVDELDALGQIDGLKDALARLRKFGGRCVLGFQSIAQVSGTYGSAGAQTIVENCSNTLILRCSGSETGGTSQFASRLIGEREVIRRQISRGADRGAPFDRGTRRSTTLSEQHVTEPAVMPSEIERLPDLAGYLKLASSDAWRTVTLAAGST